MSTDEICCDTTFPNSSCFYIVSVDLNSPLISLLKIESITKEQNPNIDCFLKSIGYVFLLFSDALFISLTVFIC